MPDVLFCHSDLHPNDPDNLSIVFLPDSLFVNLTDTKLHEYISDLSKSDPLILQHLQLSLEDIPTAFQSHLSDWKYDDHILTYKECVYVPQKTSSIVPSLSDAMTMRLLAILAILKLASSSP